MKKFNESALHSRCDRVLSRDATPPTKPSYSFRGDSTQLPSVVGTSSFVGFKNTMEYTGDAMLGVATMHKSNSVPVFSKDDAIDIAKMRRG